jgi:hypothetical protein
MILTEDQFIRNKDVDEPFFVLVRKGEKDAVLEIDKQDFSTCGVIDKTKAIIPTVKIKK